MHDFDYLEPATVEEASRLLAELGDDARIIAGGTALMLGLRQRMLAPRQLVSVARIERLRGIEFDPVRGLRIGALTRHVDLARSALVQARVPVLASMAARVANPQVRNQGTLGGNLCYADPSTDPPTCLMALDAAVTIASARGERVLSVEDFLIDYYETALEPDEIVVEIRVPPLAQGTAGVYSRFLRTAAEHRPLVGVAAVARREGAHCQDLRLAVGASLPIPQRLRRAEEHLREKRIDVGAVAAAADIVAADITPVSDLRGSDEFRREMVRVVTRRALLELFGLPAEEGVMP